MLNVIKYEFIRRKKIYIVALIAFILIEVILAGSILILSKFPMLLGLPIMISYLLIYGIYIYLFTDSVMSFSSDLNRKHSYMLFLTPTKSHQLINAKLLISTLQFFIFTLLTIIFIYLDIKLAIAVIPTDFKEAFNLLSPPLSIFISPKFLVLSMFSFLLTWLMNILMAYFSMVLRKSLFSDLKIAWALSIAIYIGLYTVTSIINFLIMIVCGYLKDMNGYMEAALTGLSYDFFSSFSKYIFISLGLYLVLGFFFYFFTNKLMKDKINI